MSSPDDEASLRPGDFALLSVTGYTPEGSSITPNLLQLRDTVAVLVGAGNVPQRLEEQLTGQSLGDSGRFELRPDGSTAPVSRLSNTIHKPVATALDSVGIDNPWTFVAWDPETPAEQLRRDTKQVERFQNRVRSSLSGLYVEYETVEIYRWSNATPDADPDLDGVAGDDPDTAPDGASGSEASPRVEHANNFADGLVEKAYESRATIRTDLAEGGVFSVSGIDPTLSDGEKVRLHYEGSDPDADDVVRIEKVDDT
jgi:hypothetical protein